MPREQINFPHPQVTHSGSIDENGIVEQSSETHTDAAIHVQWLRGAEHDTPGHVQIAFEADPSYLKIVVAEPNELDGRTSAYSPVLSRAEINKMIQVLRKARDQAYGRDE